MAGRLRRSLLERASSSAWYRLRDSGRELRNTCADNWDNLRIGPGEREIERILRFSVVAAGISLGVLFAVRECRYDEGFTLDTVLTSLLVIAFGRSVLPGWKGPAEAALAAMAVVVRAAPRLAVIPIVAVGFGAYLLLLVATATPVLAASYSLQLATRLWRGTRRVTYQCPYDDCSYRGDPVHVCKCQNQYRDLRPNSCGILHHTCRHIDGDVRLPTLDLLGRNALPRLCAGCGRPLVLPSIGAVAEWPIALVGGRSTGKTVFLRQAVRALCQRLAARPGGQVSIDSAAQRREWEQDLGLLDRGQVPRPTAGTGLPAFGIAIRSAVPRRLRSLLYLFDAPGEDYETMSRFLRKQSFRNLAGIILLVDASSLPALVAQTCTRDGGTSPTVPSFERVVAILIAGIAPWLQRFSGRKCEIPLAVVVGKVERPAGYWECDPGRARSGGRPDRERSIRRPPAGVDPARLRKRRPRP